MEEIRRWSHIYENGAPTFVEHYNSTTHKATMFVPERTCHREKRGTKMDGSPKLRCSLCGYGIGDKRWSYCPFCGAKVVE